MVRQKTSAFARPSTKAQRRAEDRKGMVFVISGPSGSGKTTLIKRLLRKQKIKKNLARIITYTTRPPRQGETDGRDYVFVKREEFKERIKKRKFLEWQRILGQYYGTPKDEVEKNVLCGRDTLLCIDVRGAKALKKKRRYRFVYIFILPASKKWRDTLKTRLKRRSTDSQIAIRRRIKLAEKELSCAKYYDYVLVNKNVERTVEELAEIIALEKRRG